MKHESFNESAEMYLKTVSELAAPDALAPISALADRLGVSAVSATEMVHRLQEHGLVAHQPYRGVGLTDSGRQLAGEVVRRHRLWECFLFERLGLPWAEVHDYACRLEHATTPAVTEALDAYLGRPAFCPHGNPIPALITPPDEQPLGELPIGRSAVVVRVYPETDGLLGYLAELDLLPGRCFTLREIAPFQGPLVLLTDAGIRYVGREAAVHVYVRQLSEEPA
ncbi:MAG: metal-dependent transcriptional regulator [Candidatus Promineofilum sp.]|nr:metal-dependent transcriptional regulator [Promineifilum sp.]